MRRIAGLVLVALGVALIALAIALPTYVYPRVAKAPIDPNTQLVARGEGITVLLPRSIEDGGTQIFNNQVVTVTRSIDGELRQGAPMPADDERFYRLSFRADVEGKGLLQAYVEGACFNQETGLATNCGGDYLVTDPTDTQGQPIEHRGLMFKFPFNTERRDYPFWDVNIKAPATARYDGTERLNGLLTYRFVQVIQDTVIGQQDIPGELIGDPQTPSLTADRIYSTKRTLWVEPYTGAIIKGSEQVNQRLAADGKQAPIITGYLEYTPETVQANVDEYGESASGLRFVSRIGPIGGWILGPIFLLVGLGLLAMSRRRERDDEWTDDRTHYQTV
jgi:hypothetical protein